MYKCRVSGLRVHWMTNCNDSPLNPTYENLNVKSNRRK